MRAMRARLGMCAAVLSVAALASSGTSSGDALSAVGTIAYESQSTVYLADADGTGTHALVGAYAPGWSPDGKKLAIDAGIDLETIKADGTQRIVLVSGAGLIDPAWSPDGTKIAYADTNTSHYGIWVVPTAGGAPSRLSSAGVETSPTWSPDGTQIAFFESDITANPPNIWIMNADGSNQHELTTVDLPDPGSFNLRNLAWSPDGTKLAYSTGAEPEVYGAGALPASIAVVDTGGSNEHILVSAPAHSTFTDPSWSPDGSSLIFSDTNLAGPVQTTQGLDIANADGSGRRSLLTASGGYTVDTAQWIAGVPGAPTGVSATAGDGRVTISFGPPATNGGAAITSYTSTAAPGGASATESGSPLTVTGLTNGTSYTFSVAAANKIGVGAPATVSATPVAAGGGGGGGGGGLPPNLAVTLGASAQPHSVGDDFAYRATVSNKGGTSASTDLSLSLPTGVSYASSRADRGPGCSATGQTVDCPLDFFPTGLTTVVVVNVEVRNLGTLTATASLTSTPGDADPSDNSASLTLQVPPTSPPPVATPVPGSSPKGTKTAKITVRSPKAVSLAAATPKLTLTVELSKAVTLQLRLLDAKGHLIAEWTRNVKAGTTKLTLTLPVRARKRGHDELKITSTGKTSINAKTLPVVVGA